MSAPQSFCRCGAPRYWSAPSCVECYARKVIAERVDARRLSTHRRELRTELLRGCESALDQAREWVLVRQGRAMVPEATRLLMLAAACWEARRQLEER